MAGFMDKLPDLNEIGSMAGKLFKDVKSSVSEIIEDYKVKHPEPKQPTEAKPTEIKPSEVKVDAAAKEQLPPTKSEAAKVAVVKSKPENTDTVENKKE